jgi:hypothetical protein
MPAFTEVRPFVPLDVPLLHRLHASGVTLDSAARLTRGINALEGAMLHAVPLADLGMPTYVAKLRETAYVAQYRHKNNDQHAHIVFIAPEVDSDDGPEAWLQLISAMVSSAAKRGAFTLNAEVDDGSLACEVLHRAGFATYARQAIWRRSPAPITEGNAALWRPAVESDAISIAALYASIVPRLVMQADAPPDLSKHAGVVYERQGRIAAYITIQEGKHGVYLQPYLHPECSGNETDALLAGVLAGLPRADKVPVYLCVRRYQAWLHNALDAQRFEVWTNEAVMVKHTTARIEHPAFKPAYTLDRVAAAYPGQRVGSGFKRFEVYRESIAFDGISHHGRSGKTEGGSPSLSGGCA